MIIGNTILSSCVCVLEEASLRKSPNPEEQPEPVPLATVPPMARSHVAERILSVVISVLEDDTILVLNTRVSTFVTQGMAARPPA